MDRYDQMTAYVAILEEGSLAAAARRLGSSPPAVSRALAALEERLGVPLIRRTTRRLAATDAGQRYFATCQRLIAEIDQADREAAGESAAPHGLLRVTAPLLFGRLYVAPAVTEYVRRFPETRAELTLVDRIVDLIDEGLDVAVRIGQLPDSSLVARKVGAVRRVLCASPDYLARKGTPRTLRDLAAHDVVAFSGITGPDTWRFRTPVGPVSVPVKPRLIFNQADPAIAAVLDGFGISRILSYQVAELVAQGRLVQLLPDLEDDPLPVQVVTDRHRLPVPKVRAFVDLAAAMLSAEMARRLGAQ
jgi:DNA-binding transcriptional LysR family regulator